MRNRRPSDLPAKPQRPARANFHQRYDQLEMRRAALVSRLAALGETAPRHPAYKGVLKLLNDTFRRTRLPKRLAVLQAAAWMIDVLEKLVQAGGDWTR
jgi:hypothetical protein